MSFFIKNKNKKKQVTKKVGFDKPSSTNKKSTLKRKRFKGENEEIESDSDVDENDTVDKRSRVEYSSSDEDVETPAEKKLRLAKQYLAQIDAKERETEDTDDLHKDVIAHRLKQDLLEQTGKLQREVANNVVSPLPDDLVLFRGHQLSVTCVVISPDNQFVYSGGKDCSIIKWSLKERRKVHTIHGGRKGTENKHLGHTSHILAMALSSDGQFLATGDRNKLIHLWDGDTCEHIYTFRGHRDAISGLTFRKDTHQLYSCSHDRSVKIWNVDEKAYVETLFGHQDKVTAIDSLTRERAVTSGGRDSSVRVWKIIEESQLVFNAHHSCSVDCIALINESNFISGADDNSLSLWGVMKKKPYTTVRNAHSGCTPEPAIDPPTPSIDPSTPAIDPSTPAIGPSTEGANTKPYTGRAHKTAQENWITAVAALHNTDLIASGSRDGCVRLWRCSTEHKKLEPVCTVPITGFVNCLKFSADGSYLVAGIGQEHSLGRWWTNKKAKNGICIIPIKTIVKR